MFKQLARKLIYECEWLALYSDRVETSDGSIIEKYHQLDFKKNSVVILVENNHKICMLKSYQYTIDKINIELPAGYVENNEAIEKAAIREVFEETGINIAKPQFLFEFYPSNGISNQTIKVLYAQALSDINKPINHEGIYDVFWADINEIAEMVDSNSISDGITLLALTKYLRMKRN